MSDPCKALERTTPLSAAPQGRHCRSSDQSRSHLRARAFHSATAPGSSLPDTWQAPRRSHCRPQLRFHLLRPTAATRPTRPALHNPRWSAEIAGTILRHCEHRRRWARLVQPSPFLPIRPSLGRAGRGSHQAIDTAHPSSMATGAGRKPSRQSSPQFGPRNPARFLPQSPSALYRAPNPAQSSPWAESALGIPSMRQLAMALVSPAQAAQRWAFRQPLDKTVS